MSLTDEETTSDALVAMRGITIQFPGVKALDDVDLTLRGGEIHALMGENGAGKSTLIKALTGEYAVDAGSIAVAGEQRVFHGTADAQQAGVSTVYQEVNLCANLSVGENVMLGHEVRHAGRIDWRATHRAAVGHLQNLGLRLDTRTALGSHSIAVQQLVAISRAMVTEAKVLVLDEPTSSLDRGEVQQLFAVMRDLQSRGVAVLFVTHFLDQVFEISDRCTVLRNGRLVGDYPIDELSPGRLVSLMLGRELEDLAALSGASDRPVDRSGTPVVRMKGAGRKGLIEPVDVDVYPGEVVGIAGLLGSGRTELARVLAGAEHADQGQIEVAGKAVRLTTPRHGIDHGIAYSPEDRRAEGILGDLTVAENIVLGIQARRGWRKVRRSEQDALVSEYIAALGIRPANPHVLIRNLSGGNQQKVLLARWLATAPALLILDEPTRGIDVGAKADIQSKVAELSEQGLSVVFISSELEEVLRLSQRIVVMREHRKIGELASSETDVDGLIDFIAHEGREGAA
ncbi:Fructose import ATP-binding protein FruK [Cellulomonas sp. T2.31MG-18]|uniref:sugar ABC transporter ATP-binding protein n=1 Tax=Cellulomonas sp. T2.31MG-18 TaxID=3157619 RepID=UPI0035EC7598